MVNPLWYELWADVLVNLSAAGIAGAVIGAISHYESIPEDRFLLVFSNVVVGLITLLSAFLLRTLAT